SKSIDDIRSLRLITAVNTPYLSNGQIDLESYDNLVNMQIENGVEGILVAGTVGEDQLISLNDKVMLIAHTVNSFGEKVKVIGNAGSNSTSQAIILTEQGFAVGMDAALHINPYYGKTSINGRTAQDIPPSVVEILAQNPNFVGIKECVGNERVKKYSSEGIIVWTANDEESHDARWEYGAIGDMSIASNLIPSLMLKLMIDGKNPLLNSKLMPLFDWLCLEPAPIALNTALAQLGVIKPVFRLPHVPLSMERRVEFLKLVKQIGREHFVGENDVEVLDDHDFIIVGRY
ncbi:4-hydroxy-tetrahydrodipicolinate synthase chloroplastic-like, partial [Trifolium pratense]